MNFEVENIYGKISNPKQSVKIVGSKSITTRALLLAALANGQSTLLGVQFSDDCKTFLNCLNGLGIKTHTEGDTVKIKGCGGKLGVTEAEINVGSAGTAARFLPAFLAFQRGKFTLYCSEQMKARPIEPLIKSLESLGAKFTFLGERNCYPFIIEGAENVADNVRADISKSSQFLSALLMACPCAGKTISITAVGSHGLDYVNMTAEMMRSFGVNVQKNGAAYTVKGTYSATDYQIEADVSAACYFYAMNKILGTQISVEGISQHSLQGDMKFIEILQDFNGGKVDMHEFSDQTLTLAAIAPYLEKPTHITGAKHIRGQECDRIAAIVYNLNAMGIKCDENVDGVEIFPAAPKPAHIKTFGDHRVAMSFALTGLRADGIVIENAEVCSKTFENYFTVLNDLIKGLTEK